MNKLDGLFVLLAMVAFAMAVINHQSASIAEQRAKDLEDSLARERKANDFFFSWRDRFTKAFRREFEPLKELARLIGKTYPQLGAVADSRNWHPAQLAAKIIEALTQQLHTMQRTNAMLRQQLDVNFHRCSEVEESRRRYVDFSMVVSNYFAEKAWYEKRPSAKRRQRMEDALKRVETSLGELHNTGGFDSGGQAGQAVGNAAADTLADVLTRKEPQVIQASNPWLLAGQLGAGFRKGPVFKKMFGLPVLSEKKQ